MTTTTYVLSRCDYVYFLPHATASGLNTVSEALGQGASRRATREGASPE